jgi:hypothetical protein
MLVLFLTCEGLVHATTRNATTCSLGDVTAAYNTAVTGDSVVLPSCGSTSWSSTLVIDKGITISGQTTCTGSGATLSCKSGTTINGNGVSAIQINADNARVTGITLTGGVNGGGVIETTANASGWRVDHMRITPTLGGTARGAFSYGIGSGLYDHVYFDTADGGVDVDGANGDNRTYSVCESAGVSCDGTYSWSHPTTLGDSGAVYVEDCYFDFSSALDGAYDAYGGARLVFRYNYVSGTNIGGHGLDSGGERSTLRQEVYRNTFVNGGSSLYTVWNSRGGLHMLFGNTISATGGSFDSFYWLQNYRSDSSPSGWGACDGSNSIDQNSTSHGYACRDQVGRGPETAPANDWPQKSSAPYTFSEPLIPGYSFANSFKNSTPTVSDLYVTASGSDSTAVQTYDILNNRDFYTEVAGFNGTTGTGTGLLGARPSNCTTGVAYWATDQGKWNTAGNGGQGVLYKCTSANTWTSYYTPYTYPHPLQGGGGALPDPPTNVIGVVQ